MTERVSSLAETGNRQLQSSSDIYEHNAWDNAEMDEGMLQEAIKQISLQTPVENPQIYNENPASYWDKFYSLNQNKFFKDRNWLSIEFPELFEIPDDLPENSPFTICEIGCGAGNTCYPWLTINKDKNVFAYACDYSAEAIKVVKQNSMYNEKKMKALVLDITTKSEMEIQESSVDICVCIFVLSALHPSEWKQAVDNIYKMLKPGGLVLLRDYGRYDLTQTRMKKARKLDEDNFYKRGDGTRVYFFTQADLESMFAERFEILQNASDKRLLVNRQRHLKMFRCWQQGKFRAKK